MRCRARLIAAAIVPLLLSSAAMAASSKDILSKVRSAEASFKDFKADMFITQGDKENVSGMGEGYGDILMMDKGTVAYKKPDRIRLDGYARSIKATYIQNGYTKMVIASMIKQRENVRNAPGKRQNSLDMGFLSSWLWSDNSVSVVSTDSKGIMKLKFDPKYGDKDKRHDYVWVEPTTLKVLKREKYKGDGSLRVRMVYSDFHPLVSGLPIATSSTLYDPEGGKLGTVVYKNVKVNSGLPESLFSMSAR